jgi:hypothetical protein
MYRSLITGFAAAAAISGGLQFAVLGFAPSTAQAAEECAPWNANVAPCAPPEGQPTCNAFGQCGQLWCPASGMKAEAGWDTSVCQTRSRSWATPRARRRLRRRRASRSSTACLG